MEVQGPLFDSTPIQFFSTMVEDHFVIDAAKVFTYVRSRVVVKKKEKEMVIHWRKKALEIGPLKVILFFRYFFLLKTGFTLSVLTAFVSLKRPQGKPSDSIVL